MRLSTKQREEIIKKASRDHAANIWHLARGYERDVESGVQITSNWIKLAVKREKKLRKKYLFKPEKVTEVFRFLYYVNITVGEDTVRFTPSPWQAWIIMCIYGLYRVKSSSKRVRRFSLIWVGRKSGKTTLAAILALFSFLKEDKNSEVYFTATTKDQASQALRYLKQMVTDSPSLNKRVKRLQYKLRHISKEKGTCYAKPLANEPDKLDGLSPSFAIIDESHALPDKELFNIIKTGTLARKNPLIIQISTAGTNKDYPFFNDIEIGKKVLLGEIQDDPTFYALYTLDDEEEINNTKVWVKSNPGLDVIIDIEDLIIDWEKAKLTITDKKHFIVKNLNVYADGEDTWIPDEIYRKNFNDVGIKELLHCKAYLGLDLSSARDLASLVCIIEHPVTKKLQVLPEFYFPSNSIDKKIRVSGLDLGEWIDKGYILEHEGNITDYDKIFERIVWFCENFDVQAIGYDPWNAIILTERIKAEIGVEMISCNQNTGFFNFPLKFLERLIFSENIDLSKNPVLRWNFRNIVIHQDGNGNIKIMKNKSLDSVDGAVSLAMAMGMYCNINYDAIYEIMKDINHIQYK